MIRETKARRALRASRRKLWSSPYSEEESQFTLHSTCPAICRCPSTNLASYPGESRSNCYHNNSSSASVIYTSPSASSTALQSNATLSASF